MGVCQPPGMRTRVGLVGDMLEVLIGKRFALEKIGLGWNDREVKLGVCIKYESRRGVGVLVSGLFPRLTVLALT